MSRQTTTVLSVLFGLTAALSACGPTKGTTNTASYFTPGDFEQSAAGGCGVERWAVKTGTDADIGNVSLTAQATTISTLGAVAAPSSLPANNRIPPQEEQVYTLTNVTLVEYKLENDSDVHLVLTDGTNGMIGEIPSPSCVGASSPFTNAINAARTAFTAKYTPTSSFQSANVPVTVTGVGFFDMPHGQTGHAPNFIELHPVLSICFGTNCAGGASNDFSVAVSPASQSVAGGGSVSYQVTTAVASGSAENVNLSVTGLPAGVTATVSPTTVTSGGTATVTLSASATAAPGSTSFTVTGTDGTNTHSASAQVTVTNTDFAISAAPSSLSLTAGNGGSYTINTTAISGSPTLALTMSSAPTGVTASLSAGQVTAGNPVTLSVSTTATTPAQNASITITATDASGTLTATVALNISSGSTGANLISNGGFENNGLAGWTRAGTVSVSSVAHSGAASAEVGSNQPGGDSAVSQTLTLPSGLSTLSFWYQMVCLDDVHYDWASVVILNSAGATLGQALAPTCTNDGTWQQVSFDLSPFAGKTVTIAFQNHDDGYPGDPTYTLYDDISVTAAKTKGSPPTTAITAPVNGATVNGVTNIDATATDATSVTKVEFYVDGTLLATSTTSPYVASWDTTKTANGAHALTTQAYDPSGNVGTSGTVNVTVSNTTATGLKTVFIILMENHNWSSISGSSSAPYINGTLLPMGSHAEAYNNVPGLHPSLPNYLWLEAGTNFGVTADGTPSQFPQSTTQHLVTQLQNAGISWKSYQEGISGTTCPLTNSGLYAPKHNAVVYFNDINGNLSTSSTECIQHVRPFSELATDLSNGTVAQYNFITPNLCDDMHNSTGCASSDSVANGDNWLAANVPNILSSAAYKNGGALFITWDESEGGDLPIGMIVLSPQAKGGGYSNTVAYTHSSTLRTMQEIFGVTPLLGDAANATDLSDLFQKFP